MSLALVSPAESLGYFEGPTLIYRIVSTYRLVSQEEEWRHAAHPAHSAGPQGEDTGGHRRRRDTAVCAPWRGRDIARRRRRGRRVHQGRDLRQLPKQARARRRRDR